MLGEDPRVLRPSDGWMAPAAPGTSSDVCNPPMEYRRDMVGLLQGYHRNKVGLLYDGCRNIAGILQDYCGIIEGVL